MTFSTVCTTKLNDTSNHVDCSDLWISHYLVFTFTLFFYFLPTTQLITLLHIQLYSWLLMTAVTKMSAFIIKNWIKIMLNLIHLFPDRGQIHKKNRSQVLCFISSSDVDWKSLWLWCMITGLVMSEREGCIDLQSFDCVI